MKSELKRLMFLLCYFMILFFSCTFINGYNNLPIEGEIYIYPEEGYEEIEPCVPSVYISFSSEKEYNYCNYIIDVEKKIRGDTLLLTVNGVIAPDVGLTALGPARASVVIENSIDFRFIKVQIKDEFSLYSADLNSAYINIHKINVDTITSAKYEKYFRHPVNSFFVRISSDSTAGSRCTDFITALKEDLSITEFSFPEDGINPYTGLAGNESNMTSDYLYFFKYDEDGVFDQSGSLLASFDVDSSEIYQILLKSWKNAEYYKTR